MEKKHQPQKGFLGRGALLFCPPFCSPEKKNPNPITHTHTPTTQQVRLPPPIFFAPHTSALVGQPASAFGVLLGELLTRRIQNDALAVLIDALERGQLPTAPLMRGAVAAALSAPARHTTVVGAGAGGPTPAAIAVTRVQAFLAANPTANAANAPANASLPYDSLFEPAVDVWRDVDRATRGTKTSISISRTLTVNDLPELADVVQNSPPVGASLVWGANPPPPLSHPNHSGNNAAANAAAIQQRLAAGTTAPNPWAIYIMGFVGAEVHNTGTQLVLGLGALDIQPHFVVASLCSTGPMRLTVRVRLVPNGRDGRLRGVSLGTISRVHDAALARALAPFTGPPDHHRGWGRYNEEQNLR